MDPLYQKILKESSLKKIENKKFFDKLKKAAPKNLDVVCNNFHNKAFENIDCLKCANCCRTTGPLLLNKDIERIANGMNKKPMEFFEKYLRVDEDNDIVFKSMPCPFIGDDNHCGIYDNRPKACKEFPHTQQRNILQKLKITYENSLICPAVAKVTELLKEKYSQ